VVRVVLTESPDEFAVHAGELLASRIEHNVLATVLEQVRRGARRTALFAYVESAPGAVVAVALRTPPRRMLASTMDPTTADMLVGAWLERDPELPGVGAPREVARWLGRAWEQRAGGRASLAIAEALHTVDRVNDPARPASGRLRPARGDDRELLVGWMRDFALETEISDGADASEIVDHRLDRGLLTIWEDGGPVAMVGNSPPVAGLVRIGPVYTPPGRRSRGYASSAVAALSRAVLDGGARQCMLYTDVGNATSNRIYAALGYRRVAEWEELAFTRTAVAAPRIVAQSK
jgi:predicted GNAT family acetyltransferase